MDHFSTLLNHLLVDTFHSILKVEEQIIKSWGKYNLSISEIHLIESVGDSGGVGSTISDIAEDLRITLSSVTVAVNKLVQKGYLQKAKGFGDGRTVVVTLTKDGHTVYKVHERFHEQMVRNITSNLEDDEIQSMMRGITKLNEFFKQKIKSSEA